MEAFKHRLGPKEVRAAAAHLGRVHRGFDAAAFERAALRGLGALEFKARAQHVSAALETHLPSDFDRAADVLERALADASEGDDLSQLETNSTGLAGWIVWPCTEFVARRGIDRPERALDCLHALTQRFTAEWAIRPFLEQHRKVTLARLETWCDDRSPHVRRLVSEGSRPRLPWGRPLRFLIEDPSPTLPLLARLLDDPSAYVRRSVANHLNDIAKDHGQRVVDWLQSQGADRSPERTALARHACRTLIKSGHPGALALFGLGRRLAGTARLTLRPKRVVLGDSLRIAVHIESAARVPQTLEIDYTVHHVEGNGSTSPKVFKGWRKVLEPGQSLTLEKEHKLRPITTRRYHGGAHPVELMVNGQCEAKDQFRLVVDP